MLWRSGRIEETWCEGVPITCFGRRCSLVCLNSSLSRSPSPSDFLFHFSSSFSSLFINEYNSILMVHYIRSPSFLSTSFVLVLPRSSSFFLVLRRFFFNILSLIPFCFLLQVAAGDHCFDEWHKRVHQYNTTTSNKKDIRQSCEDHFAGVRFLLRNAQV